MRQSSDGPTSPTDQGYFAISLQDCCFYDLDLFGSFWQPLLLRGKDIAIRHFHTARIIGWCVCWRCKSLVTLTSIQNMKESLLHSVILTFSVKIQAPCYKNIFFSSQLFAQKHPHQVSKDLFNPVTAFCHFFLLLNPFPSTHFDAYLRVCVCVTQMTGLFPFFVIITFWGSCRKLLLRVSHRSQSVCLGVQTHCIGVKTNAESQQKILEWVESSHLNFRR